MSVTIERMKVSPVRATMAASLLDLSTKARDILGYAGLHAAITSTSFLAQLVALGITPLDDNAVQKYMRSKERTGMFSGTKTYIRVVLPIAGLLLGIALKSLMALSHAPHDSGKELGCLIASIMFTFVGLIVLFGNMDKVGHGRQLNREWQAESLARYTGHVPEFVLNKAMQIKLAMPKAEFTVHGLVTVTDTRAFVVRDPDPFLSVTIGNERYFIEVWDEAKFEKLLLT